MELVKLKSRRLLSGLTIAALMLGSVAVAAEQVKVVVIPLSSSKSSGGKFVDGVDPADAVYAGGNVGIGTTTPGSALEVNGSISFTDGVPTVTSAGQVWMDRNLGALRAATKSADPDAYGSLYQWGRSGDGHEYRTSPTTATLSDNPNHGSFITVSASPYDWRTNPDDTLWANESSTNNPCPAGFRLPTEAELETERISWGNNISGNNAASAFGSPLKLVVAGYRHLNDGTIYSVGSYGNYWSASVNGSYSRYLDFYSDYANMYDHGRANGYSVRCLKD